MLADEDAVAAVGTDAGIGEVMLSPLAVLILHAIDAGVGVLFGNAENRRILLRAFPDGVVLHDEAPVTIMGGVGIVEALGTVAVPDDAGEAAILDDIGQVLAAGHVFDTQRLGIAS